MINGRKTRLRHKRADDAQNDYNWQVDPELTNFDAIKPLAITFPRYLAEYANILDHPSPKRIQFAIETLDGEHIGNCACYNINETKGVAEVGIMIGNRDFWDKGYGSDAVTTLVDHIFQKTNLKQLHLKTLDYNYRAQRCFQKCGFVPYGRGDDDDHSFILMKLERRQWRQQTKELKTSLGRLGKNAQDI